MNNISLTPQNMSQDRMNRMLGFSGGKQSYRVVKADNGSTGREASGEFVHSYKNEAGEWENQFLGKEITGVILMALVRLEQRIDNGQTLVWTTDDFNQQDGRPFKMYDANGEVIGLYTYAQVKEQYSHWDEFNGKKVRKNDFSYIINLYVLIEGNDKKADEIIKLRCSGASRSNWFDFSNALSKMEINPYDKYTTFRIDQEPKNLKYCIKFATGSDVKDKSKVGQNIMELLEDYSAKKAQVSDAASDVPTIQLNDGGESPSQKKVPHPADALGDDEKDDIKIEDVPF